MTSQGGPLPTGKADGHKRDQFAIMKKHFNKLAHVLNNYMKATLLNYVLYYFGLTEALRGLSSLSIPMSPHFSILAWEIPRTEGTWQVTVHGVSKESDTT